MKKMIVKIFILVVCFFQYSLIILADPPGPPDPGGDPSGNGVPVGAPIDNGVVVLLILGVGYTVWRLLSFRKVEADELTS